jgi:hypothetical protein
LNSHDILDSIHPWKFDKNEKGAKSMQEKKINIDDTVLMAQIINPLIITVILLLLYANIIFVQQIHNPFINKYTSIKQMFAGERGNSKNINFYPKVLPTYP